MGFSGNGAHPCKGAVGFKLVEVPAGRVSPHSSEVAAVPVGGGGAWPGFKPMRRAAEQRPGPTGVEGAGGSGGHGRASRRGAERSEALASRAAGASGAWNTRGATSSTINGAGRRPRAHKAARPA